MNVLDVDLIESCFASFDALTVRCCSDLADWQGHMWGVFRHLIGLIWLAGLPSPDVTADSALEGNLDLTLGSRVMGFELVGERQSIYRYIYPKEGLSRIQLSLYIRLYSALDSNWWDTDPPGLFARQWWT